MVAACRLLMIMAVLTVCSLPALASSRASSSPLPLWEDGWPMEGHDPQRTNQSLTSGPVHAQLLFRHRSVTAFYAYSDGTLYGFTGAGERKRAKLVSLDSGGRVRWTRRSCGRHVCGYLLLWGISPQGSLIGISQAPNETAAVMALKPDGGLLWKIEPAGPDKGGVPAITDTGQLYFLLAKTDGDLCEGVNVVNVDDGRLLACPRIDFGFASLAPDGTIYQAGTSLQAYAPNGEALWETTLSDAKPPVYLTLPLVGHGGVVYAGVGTLLSAVDRSGHLLWQVRKPDGAWALAAGLNGEILAAGRRSVAAFSPDGKLLWQRPIGPPGTEADARPSLVTDAAGTVYVGTADGMVRVWTSDGKLLQRLSVGPHASHAPTVILAGGRLIVNGTDGILRVYAQRGRTRR